MALLYCVKDAAIASIALAWSCPSPWGGVEEESHVGVLYHWKHRRNH